MLNLYCKAWERASKYILFAMQGSQERYLLNGAQVIARAAVEAGIRFFAGYPITPASYIYHEMIRLLRQVGGVAVGASDEISALSYCVGASLRGLPAMTATAAPGFSLMVETLSYALMTETPVVLVIAQRLGPATGAATASAQGDLLLAAFANSGAYPVPVLSPTSVHDAYAITQHAVRTAETLRTPVILLTEKETVMSTETVLPEHLTGPGPAARPRFSGGRPFKTYDFQDPADVPPFAPVGGPVKVRVTGSAHDREGFLKKDDPEVLETLRHLYEKIMAGLPDFFFAEQEGGPAPLTVLSFGGTARAARQAVHQARAQGIAVNLVVLKTLWPLRRDLLQPLLSGTQALIVAEENLWGQLALLLQATLPEIPIHRVNAIGRLVTPEEILEEVRRHA